MRRNRSWKPKLREPRTGTPADLLVIGLGNPGDEYAQTRHNAGRLAVETLARRHGVDLKRAMGVALWGHVRVGDKLLALGVPGTFMNMSGEGVAPLVRRYGIEDLEKLVIIHDELDIDAGRLQIKRGGGLAGHNGLKSIKHHLKDDAFTRIRIGVGRPPGQQSGADYVLRRPGASERAGFDISVETAADAAEEILSDGVQAAMNRFN